jgi:hypothetical protein
VFHYVEDSFLTDKIIETYENYMELKWVKIIFRLNWLL